MSTTASSGNSSQYVDFDEFVEFQLEKTRTSIRWIDLATAAAVVVAGFLGYLLVFVALDQWVIPGGFSRPARAALLFVWVAGTVGWLVFKVVRPWLRRINRLYAARELERAEPGLHSSLLNLIDLRDAGRPINPAVLKTLQRQAAVRLSEMDLNQAIDHRPLLRASYVLMIVVVSLCLYALLSPKQITSSLWRVLPTSTVAVATRTEILSVEPGAANAPAGQPFDVAVNLRGQLLAEIQLRYTTPDHRFHDEPVALRPEQAGGGRYTGRITGEHGSGVSQDFTYFVVAGDARSEVFSVTVEQPPSAAVEQIRLDFPPYMQLEPQVTTGGAIRGWEGAKVTVRATTNRPVASATVELLDQPDAVAKGEEVPLTVTDGRTLSGSWDLRLREGGGFAPFYRIQCRTSEGLIDPQPIVHTIQIRPDEGPEVVLLQPERDLEAAANAVIPLIVRASDPDFRLGPLRLLLEKSGEIIHTQTLSQGGRRQLLVRPELNLEPLGLQPGDIASFWVEAVDNRQPRPNRKNTPKLRITIAKPVSDQQVREQLAEQKQQQEERLADASQEQNEETRRNPPQEPGSADQPMPEAGEQPLQDADPPAGRQPPQQNAAQPKPTGEESGGEGQANEGAGGSQEKTAGTEGDQPSQGGTPPEPLSPSGEDDQKILELLKNEQPPPEGEGQDPSRASEPTPEEAASGSGAPMPGEGKNGEEKNEEQPSNPDQGKPGKGDKPRQQQTAPTEQRPDKPASESDPAAEGSDNPQPSTAETRPDQPPQPDAAAPPKPGKNGRPEKEPGKSPPKSANTSSEPQAGADPATKPDPAEAQPGHEPDSAPKSSDGKTPGKAGTPPQPSAEQTTPMNPDQTGTSESESSTGPMPGQPAAPMTGSQPNSTDQGGEKSPAPGSEASPETGAPPQAADSEAKPGQPAQAQPNSEGKPKPKSQPSGADADGPTPPGTPEPKPGEPSKATESKPAEGVTEGERQPQPGKTGSQPTGKPQTPQDPAGQGEPADSAEQNPTAKPAGQPPTQPPKSKPPTDKNSRKPAGATEPTETDAPPPKGQPQDQQPAGRPSSQTTDPKVEQTPGGTDPKAAGEPGKTPTAAGAKSEPGQPGEAPSTEPAEGAGKPAESGQGGQSKPGATGKPGGKKPAEPGSGGELGDQTAPAGGEGQPGTPPKSKPDGKPPAGEAPAEGGEPGAKKESAEGQQPGGAPEGGQEQGGGGESAGKPGSSSGTSKSNSQAAGKPAGGQAGGTATGSTGASEGPAAPPAEAPDPEYNRQAAELVLRQLQKDLDRGEVSPELLNKLGWSEDQLKAWSDRMAKQLQQTPAETPADRARQVQFEEMLKQIDLRKSTAVRQGSGQPTRELQQSDSRRAPPPAEYREAYEAFTRGLSRRSQPANNTSGK